MKKLKFIEEPGFVYDIIYTFVFNFNMEYCLSKFNVQKILDKETHVPLVSKELYPFFYLNDGEKCFIYEYYYESCIDLFNVDYGFSILYKSVSEKERLKLNFIKYYFPKLSEEEQNQGFEQLEKMCEIVRNSDYSDTMKCSMYSFFIETDKIINILLEELVKIQMWMKENYKLIEKERKAFKSQFDIEFIKKYLEKINVDIGNKPIYIIPSYLDKMCFRKYQKNKIDFLLLCTDYIQYIEHMQNSGTVPTLDVFGNAIAEKNRVDILNLMLEKDEITRKDLEQELKLTGTNSYYHLNLMLKANIIKTRTVGKNGYYSINKCSIAAVINMLEKYK